MWKSVIYNGTETNYAVSELGEIINNKTKKPIKINSGNVQLSINKKSKTFSLGRLVAEAFIPKDTEEQTLVVRIDNNPNNNKVSNLKWITDRDNSKRVWEVRRANGTTGAGVVRGPRKRENIVESINYVLKDNEKQIVLQNELIPYSIDTEGNVKNLKTGKYLKGSILHTYKYINFRWDGHNKNKAVHRLVAEAFLPNPNNLAIVDHIDGDRLNNNIQNLRWVTAQENAANKHSDINITKPEFENVAFSSQELQNEYWASYNDYQVSNLGRVKGKRLDILQGHNADCGYITYGGDHILGQVLVWSAFNGEKPQGYEINHINGNKHDNRLINLELVTHKENMQKAATTTNAWNFKPVGEFDSDGNLLNTYNNASEAGRAINILPSSMRNTIRRNGKCYNGLYYRYLDK